MKGRKLVLVLMVVLLMLLLAVPLASAAPQGGKNGGGSSSDLSYDWLVDEPDGDVLRCLEKTCKKPK